ncbi:TRAP-type C4-dicarboxylate transport system, small permease component [Marinobacterium lacunae]|uniref:TRAP transporter small permease protein n=1 Tax=Marinobacterium lacunae TaxID=1232683 RepID=A0A081G387_9GAMM|nr:TRAP transporter small permease [Marinobacterium lacunae]KEA65242.1 TRAP-type C4-dicarboxylate transport system, small permease component [Marinobacterium lacunae]
MIFILLRVLPRLGGVLSALLILMVLALICYAVLARYFFNAPLPWSDEMLGYLMVATAFLGLSSVLLDDRHIAIDLLTPLFSGAVQKAFNLLGYAVVFAVAIVFLYASWETLTFNRNFGLYSVGELDAPIWVTQIPMALGSALLALAAATKFIERLLNITPESRS